MTRKPIVNIIFLAVFAFIFGVQQMSAEILQPVKWESSIKMNDATNGTITFSATIDDGWHMYSLNSPKDGPVPLSVNWEKTDGVKLVGNLTTSKPPHEEVDLIFNMKLGWWTKSIVLTQNFSTTNGGSYAIEGYIRYMVCNGVTCQAPEKSPFSFSSAGQSVAPSQVNDSDINITSTQAESKVLDHADETQTWKPVTITSQSDNPQESLLGNSYSFWYIFISGFIGGILALLSPCVWPMIPLTVSFFLKKRSSKIQAIRDSILYGISIIIIYLFLGIVITICFGADFLNALSTNAIFNIIFFLLLLTFAFSFFGAFDITLPNSWSNKMDGYAEKTSGIISIFFMAFTLTLVSFSCTGPIIGTLLVEATRSSNIAGPAIGMAGFAIALAIPFMFFAIFPSWLKDLQKSGRNLNCVKITLGFIELALSLKFLSVADLAYGWRILDREIFVALWVAIFALLGLYLLGKIQFKHDAETKGIGVVRFMLALISLSFSIYLLPGLWGAPLKGVSAFAPPLYTQDFNLYGGKFVEYHDFDEGMDHATSEKKPVIIDFSGYGCVNCRKMESAVFDNPRIRSIIEDNYVMIKLMVDDKTKLEKPIYVDDNGKNIKLSTYGEMWSYLQRHKFQANSQPYYAVLDTNGNLLSGPYFYDEDIDKFEEFLKTGIRGFLTTK